MAISIPAGKDWIAILPDALPVAETMRFVADANAGGIDVFLGTTRAETSGSGSGLVALDYEAYEELALKQMRDLCARARTRWPIVRLALLHRVGRVELAAASVLIAVATPHRAEAFEACRWLIDTLKAEVAIWKKEVFADGDSRWVDPASRG